MTMQEAIQRLVEGSDLSAGEMTAVMRLVMTGKASPAQIGGFLVALRIKGETVEEICAAAGVMREMSTRVDVDRTNLVDTCGTGGSGTGKFNISTASAFVAAAAGARVAKHGNRAASGNSGSADLLEAAGAEISLSASQVAKCIDRTGLGFLFAQVHHGAMKHAIGPRKEMAVRTMFNVLGPLTNPAGAERQLIGVFDESWLIPLARVLKQLGSRHVMVVHADDGMDEISTSSITRIAELKDGVIETREIRPEDFGMTRVPLERLRVADSSGSLNMVRSALDTSDQAAADIVALNAGAAIYVSGIVDDLESGVEAARRVMASGEAGEKMAEFVNYTVAIRNQDG